MSVSIKVVLSIAIAAVALGPGCALSAQRDDAQSGGPAYSCGVHTPASDYWVWVQESADEAYCVSVVFETGASAVRRSVAVRTPDTTWYATRADVYPGRCTLLDVRRSGREPPPGTSSGSVVGGSVTVTSTPGVWWSNVSGWIEAELQPGADPRLPDRVWVETDQTTMLQIYCQHHEPLRR